MSICNYDECTGCAACLNVCPVNCITFKEDVEGFLRPFINESKCIQCGKCVKTCPANGDNNFNYSKNDMKAYAYINGDLKTLQGSASGGAFSALAKKILAENGVVFGACYENKFTVIHKGITREEQLQLLRDSKYVQSNIKNTYIEVKKYLEQGRLVLFTGTPCQIAGLYSSINYKKYNNLYTIDILCHGVPNPKIFRKYITYLEEKYGKIKKYTFRDKSKWGWGSWGSFIYNDKCTGKEKKRNFIVPTDYYYSLYFKDINFRESCYKCKYAAIPRIADLTLGDYWGIDDVMPNIKSRDGVSLILVNNTHGEKLISSLELSDNSRMHQTRLDDAIRYNPTIVSSTKRPKERDEFYKNFNKYGFENTAKMYCKLKYSEVLSLYLPRKFKIKIKKILKGIKK